MRGVFYSSCYVKFSVAFLALTAVGSTVAQDLAVLQLSGSDRTDPVGVIQFSPEGRIRSWGIEIADGRTVQIIDDSDRRLLALEVRLDGRDISDEIAWQSIENTAVHGIEFVGRHRTSGLRIFRSYSSPTDKPALLMSIHFEKESPISAGQIDAVLTIPSALSTHISDDRSLGDYFYGQKKTYFSQGSSFDQLFISDEDISADSIAFSSRHIGLRATQPSVSSNQKIYLTPDAPAMIRISVPQGPDVNLRSNEYSINLQLATQALMSSSITNTDFKFMLYADLWAPLRTLAHLIEGVIQRLQSVLGSLGVAVIAFALLLRLLLLPISIWSIRQQRSFSVVQDMMAPKIKEINATLKGAEKSERTLELYKEYKISPFTGLKGSAALFVQLPILIAFFAITTESALFRDVPFLWFSDLSLPDRTIPLPFTIPGMGGSVNFMPLLLGLISVFASAIQQRSAARSATKVGRGALIIVLLIVVFFYSCASALVLYWTVVNIAQILEGQFIKLRENATRLIANDSSRTT